ncbi:MAG: VWA domain-containing protein [Phycisphaerales bacterium JB039]
MTRLPFPRLPHRSLPALLIAASLTGVPVMAQNQPAAAIAPAHPEQQRALVQIALLLDTSNSMDGLINQAKTELWSIVNELAIARAHGAGPALQVALYQYGNNGLDRSKGWVQQELAFTDDLDAVSEKLFALTTNGGEEYCGWVIRDAAEQLAWSGEANALKMIVIAGNEGFDQGEVDFRSSVPGAIAKGVIVNTIFCGPDSEGRTTGWLEGAQLADGEYHNIDSDQAVAHIAAPQDDEIVRLGALINTTYLAFGAEGRAGLARQAEQDAAAEAVAPAARVQRMAAKGTALYTNTAWDLLDAIEAEEVKLEEVKDADLPEAMRGMTLEEKKAYVEAKAKERTEIQQKLQSLQQARAEFVAQKQREMAESGEQTLGQALIAAIRKQAEAKGLQFEEK